MTISTIGGKLSVAGGSLTELPPSILMAGVAGVATWTSTQQQIIDEMNLAAFAGATMVRCDLYWDLVEQTQGVRDWTRPDMMFDAADAAGLQILWVPNQSPAWARTSGEASNIYLPTNPATYGDFVSAAAARYATRGSLGSHHWQLWNEINTTYHLGDPTNKAAYVALAADAYSKIKAVDSTATVVLGSILRGGMASGQYGTYQDDLYLIDLYAAGIKNHFDVLSYHPYAYPFDPADTIDPVHTNGTTVENGWQGVAAIKAIAAANGDGGKQLWATETGQHTGTATYAVTESVQAGYIGNAFVRALNEGISRMFWFGLRDAGINLTQREQNFGIVKADFTAKPALRSFRTAAAQAMAESTPIVSMGSAPTFVGSVDSGLSFAASKTTAAISGSQAGDVLVAFAQANDQAATVTVSESGWTLRGTVALDNARILVFTKTATAAQGSVTWTYSGTHNHRVSIVCYRRAVEPTALAANAVNRIEKVIVKNLQVDHAGATLVTCGYCTNFTSSPNWSSGMTARFTGNVTVGGNAIADQAFTDSDAITGEKTFEATAGNTANATLILTAALLIPSV
jgi:polysaccharide biosynthesis protein PslG